MEFALNTTFPRPIPDLFHRVVHRPVVLNEIAKKLVLGNKDSYPLLFAPDHNGKTPLDVAIEKKYLKSIPILIDLMLRLQENLMLNSYFDKHLVTLINSG